MARLTNDESIIEEEVKTPVSCTTYYYRSTFIQEKLIQYEYLLLGEMVYKGFANAFH